MIHVQWKERLRIGHPEIDRQHQRLVAMINELVDLHNEGADVERAAPFIRGLADYALTHFRLEESYMVRCGYGELRPHKRAHEFFIHEVIRFNRQAEESPGGLLDEMLSFLKEWYIQHIMSMDKEYAPCVAAFLLTAQPRAVVFAAPLAIGALDRGLLAARLAPLAAKPAEELERTVLRGTPLLDEWACGRRSDEETAATVAAAGGFALAAPAFLEACREAFVARDDLLPLLQQLKNRCRLGLVVEAGPGLWAAALASHPAVALADACCVSYETGALRHDPATLACMRRKLDLLAEEIVYVDGDAAGISAAAAERCRTLLGGDEAELKAGLAKLGLPL